MIKVNILVYVWNEVRCASLNKVQLNHTYPATENDGLNTFAVVIEAS